MSQETKDLIKYNSERIVELINQLDETDRLVLVKQLATKFDNMRQNLEPRIESLASSTSSYFGDVGIAKS